MADSLKVEIVTRDFNRMLEELAAIDPAIEFRDVVYGVASRVVFNALYRTRAAKVSAIRRTFQDKEYTTFSGKRYKLSNRYPDELWGRIDQFLKDRLAVKLASRGLSKKSWYHLARQISPVMRDVPAYVTEANYKGADHPENANHQEITGGDNFALEIMNFSPIVQAAGGRQALLFAMRGEVGYFRQNMAHGFYRTLESRAAKYPGIFTSPVPAAAA